MKRLSLLINILLFTACATRAQMLAVNTDVAMDALMAPNIGVEMTVADKSTLSLNALIAHKPWGRNAQIAAIQPEYRYYFTGRPMQRLFVGIGALGSVYDVEIKDKRYDGICAGGGLTFGYVLPITDRLNIDFHAGFGMMAYKQKEYYVGDDYERQYSLDGNERANATGFFYSPTRIGVSLTYIIK